MMDNDTVKELNPEELAAAAGGQNLREHSMYNTFKDFFKKKGTRQTLLLCSYYLSNEESYNMVKLIEEDVAAEGR